MMLVNGVSQTQIDISDRGFQYGDGLFETLAVSNGLALFLRQHLARLEAGCRRLAIPFPDPHILAQEAQQLVQDCTHAVLKIILTRGTGGRGYRPPETVHTTRVLSLHPYPDYPPAYAENGIVARFCTTRLGLNPALAGIKHTNRLEQVLARAEWTDANIQEGIMLDINGRVIEGTMSNLFYVKNNVLHTAELSHAGVLGIIRAFVLEQALGLGIPTLEHDYTALELLSADEVFVCNSVIGIWPVKQIDSTLFAVGPLTRQMQHQLALAR